MSETTKIEVPLTLLQRLNAVMKDVDYVQKDKKIDVKDRATRRVVGSYKVVTHDMVTAAVRPALVKHGVFYYPHAMKREQVGNRTEIDLVMRFVNVDKGDDFLDVPSIGYGIDEGDKGPGKAVSYAVKYALLKALGLETGEDADNEVTKHKSSGKTVAPGPRGGTDKSPSTEHELRLVGYPGPNGRETKSYPRTPRGITAFVDDLEITCATDMTQWDINCDAIDLVLKGIEKIGAKDLHDRMKDIEANILVETAGA